MLKPCLTCGELSEQSRCPEHVTAHRTETERHRDRASSRERGYDTAWTKLSRKARSIQTYCSDCGRTDGLTADHLVWPARSLADVDVVCIGCNNRRGSSRPGTARATS